MQPQENDFTTIVKDIETHKIILPDFQREFVWRDVEMQKHLIASVFAMMPIGSILLLKSNPNDFASKNIGSKIETDRSVLDQEVKFLLDGQQRLTVLTNVFSNVIFEQCTKVSDLISPTLKRRFFLKIPRWKNLYEDKETSDILGIRNFSSPMNSYGKVEFLTGDVFPYVEVIPFQANDGNVFNPNHKLNNDLDSFCVNNLDAYLIPLYIFIPTAKNAQQSSIRKRNIIEAIGNKIVDEIMDEVLVLVNNENNESLKILLEELLDDFSFEEFSNNLASDKDNAYQSLKSALKDKSVYWTESIEKYINSCLTKMSLTEIEVTSEQRARAIDIYENLNRGGISLSTFDLIMAKVAIVSKNNFYKRIVNNIEACRDYDTKLVPSAIKGIFEKYCQSNEYIASKNTHSYSPEKNKVEKIYVDAFLDVLSLFYNNRNYDYSGYSIDHLKRYKILKIPPEVIDSNCEKICTAIDRALFFFQARCGIRSIKEINYNLMLVFVATIFTNDNYYADVKVHDKLEAWYWASVFSGEFDKDQNSVLIKQLKLFVSMISNNGSDEWIKSMTKNVLNVYNFSDEEFLLLEKVNEDRQPKKILRNYIAQYFLSKTYTAMFDSDVKVSVFSNIADSLELHHIIPLGSVKKISESSKKLRDDKNHICNSPLNFIYITQSDNKAISSKSLEEYSKSINDNAKSALWITDYSDYTSISDDNKVKNILKSRYLFLKGDIKNRIDSLLL